jgi:methyltransferase
MVTQTLFFGIVTLLMIQRLMELRRSRRNETKLLAAGGREHGAWQLVLMKLMHGAWFTSMVAEVYLLERPLVPAVAAAASVGFVSGQLLRYAAIRQLGWRWTVRVITVPGAPVVDGGVFRYLRHPNYLGVILEIVSVPLLHGAVLTALAFSIANAALLLLRIRTEEQALRLDNCYDRSFGHRRRLIPGRPART